MAYKPFKRCIFFLVDGARADVMSSMLDAGELPALRKHIQEPGSYRSAVTVFPSTTGPAHAPFITGCTPGTCDIPGIRWFDRRQPNGFTHYHQSRSYVGPGSLYMDVDLRPDIRTIFEYFDRPASVFSFLNRGLRLRENQTIMTKSWYWFYAHYTGRWQTIDDAAWGYIHRALDRHADFIFAVFPAVDEHSHHTHPFSDITLESYRAIDRAFSKLVDRLNRENALEDTLFVFSSDHGLTATHTHFELWEHLDACGLKTVYYPRILQSGCNAASMISGNGMAHVYLKKGGDWNASPVYSEIRSGFSGGDDLIGSLLSEEAIDLVAARHDDGGVVVCSRQGVAEIRETGFGLEYIRQDGDPFGYTPLPPVMDIHEALELTINTDYPDAPYQLLRLFGSQRSGDLLISARKGYDLRRLYEHPEHKATHGSLHRDHMSVPLLMNAEVTRSCVRTIDVFPSMLELMGRIAYDPVDGQSVVSPLYTEGVKA